MARAVNLKTTAVTGLDASVMGDVTLEGAKPINLGSGSAATKVAGFMKAANTFLRLLFTEKGSNALKPLEGTEFPSLLGSNVSDEKVLFALVNNYIADATEQVQAYQKAVGTPEEAQLGSTKVSAFSYNAPNSTLDFSVDLFNPLGERFTLELPSIVIT